MSVFKCKMCGGDLKPHDGQKICECEYCGSTQTIPSFDDEAKTNLFNRANYLRLNNEFSKAIVAYEQLISKFPNEAEAYWGLCLCKYGIEYVDDVRTGEKVPTCHRTLFKSILDDEDYKKAIENSDAITKPFYEREAAEIDRLQKYIIKLSQKEEPYDIFICYKESDSNGNRSLDSVLAQDIYSKLKDEGYKVFFSRITLESKLGQQYEPIIFNALKTSKVMLCVGTSIENFNSVWVKNEWSRFLDFMQTDTNKYLIPCYKNISPYDMPEEFAALQSQDLGKIGCFQDILRGLDKLFDRQHNDKVINNESNFMMSNQNIGILSNQIKDFLDKGKFEEASNLIPLAMSNDPSNWKIYIYSILCSKKVRTIEELVLTGKSLDDNKVFLDALDKCDAIGAKELKEINNCIKTTNKDQKTNNKSLTNHVKLENLDYVKDFKKIRNNKVKKLICILASVASFVIFIVGIITLNPILIGVSFWLIVPFIIALSLFVSRKIEVFKVYNLEIVVCINYNQHYLYINKTLCSEQKKTFGFDGIRMVANYEGNNFIASVSAFNSITLTLNNKAVTPIYKF